MEDARQEEERMRRHVVKTTGGGGCGGTKDDATTSQGKLERWMGSGHPGWQLADKGGGGGRLRYSFTKRAVECVFDQICSFGLNVISYVMFLCFQVHFRTKQTTCCLAYVIKYHMFLCFYVFGNAPVLGYNFFIVESMTYQFLYSLKNLYDYRWQQ